MTETERNRFLYGDASQIPAERLPLRAGPLSLIYEKGDLRTIRLGSVEVINRLYAAVRDERWGTIPMELTETERTIAPDAFRIAFEARHRDTAKGIDFRWNGAIAGEADGTITFDFDGEALSTFKRNRIGICVLHPASAAGAACILRHTDGTEEAGALPDTISPHQPFFDIAAITHEVAPGVRATVTFSGDVFEMEDQRNWLDASYKTYSTPLALPMPVEVPAGTRIRQTVTLRIDGETIPAAADSATTAGLTCDIQHETVAEFPGFGLNLPADNPEITDAAFARLNNIWLSHVRVDLDLARDDWEHTLALAGREAERLDAPLHVGLRHPLKLPDTLPEWPRVYAWILLPPTPEVAKRLRHLLPGGVPGHVVIAGGSYTNFTELNRARPETRGIDAVAFAANPQVHAFDNTSIMETPPMLAEAIRTVRTFAKDTPIYVGPLTLTGASQPNDPRQAGQFGAAWYLAALAYAAQGGAARITLCDATGPRGVVADDGTPSPLFRLLAAVGVATNGQTQGVVFSDPRAVTCLAVRSSDDAWQDIFLANLTPDVQTVTVRGMNGESARVRTLDEATPDDFSDVQVIATPGGILNLSLRAYGIAQIIAGRQIR
jgi:hypothetical protein